MNKWRIATIIVGLIIASPLIALNYWGFQMSMWTGKVVAANDAAINGETESLEIPAIPTSPLDWLRGKVDKSKNFDTEGLNSGRRITVSERIEFADILNDGEQPPEDEFKPLYVEARAQQFLSSYCYPALASIATRCAVRTSETRQNRDGTYTVSGDLTYVPNYDLGKPQTTKGGGFVRVHNAFDRSVKRLDLPEYSDASKSAYLTEAKNVCARIKIQYGNCIATSINFSVVDVSNDLDRANIVGQAAKRLRASALFEVYTLDNREKRDELDAFVTDLWAEMKL